MTPEEIKKMQEENERLKKENEEAKKTIEDKEKHIQEKTNDIVNLRKKIDDGGGAGTSPELEARLKTLEETNQAAMKNLAIERATRGNKELTEKIMKELDSVAGVPTDQNSWNEKVEKAAKIAGVTPASVSDAGSSGGSGTEPTGGEKNFAETEAGQALAKQMGITIEEPKK